MRKQHPTQLKVISEFLNYAHSHPAKLFSAKSRQPPHRQHDYDLYFSYIFAGCGQTSYILKYD